MKQSSFKYAFWGIVSGAKTERNFKIMLICFVLVITANIIFCVNKMEWAITILCCGAVLGAELTNSAIEKAIDMITDEIHPTAGTAKDMAAGASLVISAAAAVVAAIIYLPYLFDFIKEIK